MDGRGRMLVMDRRCTVADDDIAIGSVADRRLLSGVKQKSHFKGVRTVFDPHRTLAWSDWPHDRLRDAGDLGAGDRLANPKVAVGTIAAGSN